MNILQLWMKAVRPYAYSASLVPVAIGGLYARRMHPEMFSGVRLGIALAGGLLMHTAANLWNDYYDFTCGVDRKGFGEGSGVLVNAEMTPARCFRGAVMCAVLAALAGAWLVSQVGWGLLVLLAAGGLGAWVYSAGPLSPKHHALGEVWVFLTMGAGMTLGGYMSQTGRLDWGAVAAGIPAALLMTLILYANNLRDQASDRQAGLRTLPMLFAPREAILFAGVLLAAPYGLAAWMAASRLLPVATLLAVATLPLAIRWFRGIWRRPAEERDVVGMAMLHLLFGVLFILGLWIGR